MSIPSLLKTPARLRRLGRILAVLGKHGFGYVAHYLNLQRFLRPADRIRENPELAARRREYKLSAARRLVVALEDLGPTFVKLGQLMSTRPDVIPAEVVEELKRLQDQVTPFDTQLARRVIEHELGAPISEIFSEFSAAPIASASIGQVYKATLASGEDVVVKVKRPGIDRTIMRDLDLLSVLAKQAERVEELALFRPTMIVDELDRSLRRELDFVTEASFTAKFHEHLRKERHAHAPRVFWEHSTSKVLTLEALDGVRVTRFEELKKRGIDRQVLGRRIARLFLRQFFRTGLFHADPHPGNLLIDEDGTINLIDFGMVGHLDAELRRQLATTMIALVLGNVEIIVDIYTNIGVIPDDADMRLIRADVLEMIDKYYGVPLKRLDMRKLFGDVMRLARTHRVVLPRDFVLLGKALVTVSGLAYELDPDFNLAAVVRPHALALVAEKLSPVRMGREAAMSAWQINTMLRRLPHDVRQFSRKLLGGRLRLGLTIQEFEGLVPEMSRATNRIAFAIIVGAVVIGSSFVIHARIPPFLDAVPLVGKYLGTVMEQVSLLGLAGYLFAGVLGLALAWGIWRHGRL